MTKVDQLLEKGTAALQSGQMADAERRFRKAVEAEPGHFGALNLLAVALNGLQRFDDAEKVAVRALRIDGSSDATHYNYATILKQNGKPEEAITAFGKALAINPRHIKALNNRGAALSELERYEEAIADFDRAIALDRRYSDVYYNKANALMALKRRADALRNFELTLSLSPRHAGAYANLVILFNELGEYAKAIECGRRALALDPDSPDVYLNLAVAEQGRSQRPAALGWLDVLLVRHPGSLLGLCARGSLLVVLDRLDEARRDLTRAQGSAPRDAKERAAFEGASAELLLAEGRYEDGVAAYDRAIEPLGPSRENMMIARAAAMETFGKKDEALQALDQALELYPSSAPAWRSRADLVKFKPGDPAIARMAALLEQDGGQSYNDRVQLQFALGKAYLDTGDSPAAFRHLDAGNRLKRAVSPYDSDATHKYFADIAETFTPALLDRLGDQGARSSAPIFVVGMPRSGTTLIEQILAAHPAVRGTGEPHTIERIVASVADYPAGVANLDANRLRQLGEDYLAWIAKVADGKSRVVDKMPGNFTSVGFIRLILPDAKIIHSRRDPVDTCLSCYTKLFGGTMNFTYDLTDLGRYHRDYQTLMAHWRATMPPAHFLEIDYEAVVDDIESEARRMLEFLELPWDPACLEFHRLERPVRTASVSQVREPIYRTSLGRWRQHADALAPLLQALGIQALEIDAPFVA
jgi:tetratricopeptide (TPR) repeat protein